MTLPTTPTVEIRLGTGPAFGDVLILGDAADGILGTNVLGTSVVEVVDVSPTVQRISIRRGRDRMFEQYSPGTATVLGTFFGALFIGTINNGLNLIGMDTYIQSIVKGAIILIAVAIVSRSTKLNLL